MGTTGVRGRLGSKSRSIVGLLLAGVCTATLTGCAGSGGGDHGPPREQWPVPTEPAEVRTSWTSCAVEAFPPVKPPKAGPGDGTNSGTGPGAGTSPDTGPGNGTGPEAGTRDGTLLPPPARDALTLPRLPENFVATTAVLCLQGPRTRPDRGEDLVHFEKRAENVDELVTALRLPDEPRTGDPCPLNLVLVPWFAVLDAEGRWTRPGVPRNACGQPRGEVMRALDQLTLTEVSARPIREIESAGAAASGCGQGRADTVAMQTRLAPAMTPGPVDDLPLGSARQVRLCVYRVPADQQGNEKPAGDFEYGLLLPADRWARLRAALVNRGPARDCALPAGRFALLQAPDDAGKGDVTVELDGCRRVLVTTGSGRSTLAQGDAALTDLLGR
ncbi:hypothetical protein [Plantactinospora sonchi]|uniref:DUF3558 domain-containing protein n=1 Tax=Plantactinospora sonchi TaxID=1544735 RepID=A0ABU7S504_9ACTN